MLNEMRAKVFVPDGTPVSEALARTTHLAVSAHQDDIEIMAYDGISRCFGKKDKWFTAVVLTDGSGSPRSGPYQNFTDEQMREIRKHEQKKAAVIGDYSALIILEHPSSNIRDRDDHTVVSELMEIIKAARPQFIYTHNPADKHMTHVAAALRVICALRELPDDLHPEKLYGCEVWRSLDWLCDEDTVVFDVSASPNISAALIGVFDSQITGGKRYDLAAPARRTANATFHKYDAADTSDALSYAMDLTPLITDRNLDICGYVTSFIDRFRDNAARSVTSLIPNRSG
jgi:LmbE family N-acetylglucosaminyl deacetylase